MKNSILKMMMALLLISASPSLLYSSTSPYPYTSVDGDPFGMRLYTLENGLKIYISVNKAEPRVQTNIAVRTGSKQDPSDATGLAHYLEHMLFKGTSKLGSLNWEEESKKLDEISGLYEKLRAEKDETKREAILADIDRVSGEAAKFVAANEYDKLISAMGAQGTNAYTSNERTVYINDIPSNELERWLALESERFSELVLRLFHTELEAVYEEFNRAQDNDFRLAYYKLLDVLFPTHPYGQQTTIGTGEHLKNPSMVKIHDYFKRRYVPNNMAIVLAGDIDPDATVALVEKYFGGFKKQEVVNPVMPKEKPLTEPKIMDVYGSDAEFEMIAFRLDGAGSKDDLYAELLDGVLSNGTAGLIDLNLIQQQKVLRARTSASIMEDYGYFMMSGNNRNGQELEDVRKLLLEQIDLVKKGEFDDWMIDAVVKMFKKDMMSQMEANWIRAYLMSDAFILKQDWKSMVTRYDRMAKITKEELVAWTKEKFSNNYVAVNKRIGEKDVHKVAKPNITQVEINREETSSFFKTVNTMPSTRLKPVFNDFSTAIQQDKIKGLVPIQYAKNTTNEIYRMYYVFEMGTLHDPLTAMAFEYLPYLGTDEMTPAEVQKEMFKLGLDFRVVSNLERSYVIVSGLQENFEDGITFFEKLLKSVEANQDSYNELVQGIVKKRADKKLSKRSILFRAMTNYAKYGPINPYNKVISEAELQDTDPKELVQRIRTLTGYEHRILFYGPQEFSEVKSIIEARHNVQPTLKPIPDVRMPEQIETNENKVYFVEYDMVQTELMMYHRDTPLDIERMPQAKIFSEYFGSGLSSIVFQEIRESRALAYTSYAGYSVPSKMDEHHYVMGYLGTQANKLGDATNALLELMMELPRADLQFEQSKLSALKKIETNRTTGQSILWAYQSAIDRGIDFDINKQLYPAINDMTFDDLQAFFDTHVKGKTYTYLVIGKRAEMDMSALDALGPVEELTLEQIFGY